MMAQLKRLGEAAGAGLAVWAIIVALVGLVGGHLPPWATYAWAQSQQQLTSQLTVLVLSDKVAQIQAALAAHPGDVNLQASLNYWKIQLQVAMDESLPAKARK